MRLGADTSALLQVIAAFVTFNCYGSAQRCLHDYRGSESWFRKRFQPTPLQFNGTHPLYDCSSLQ